MKCKFYRNLGLSYTSASKTKKINEARKWRPPCDDQCSKLAWTKKSNEDERQKNLLVTGSWGFIKAAHFYCFFYVIYSTKV